MDLAVWRDISLLWLILLTLVSALPFAVLFFFAVKGMRRLRQLAEQYLPVAQERTRKAADAAEQISQKVASPVIRGRATTAQVSGVIKAIFARRKEA
jgi:hypothetical protein